MSKISTATATITGTAPLSQSRKHEDPMKPGERREAHDERTWRSKLNLNPKTGNVAIPQHGMHQAIMAAARYSGKQIPEQGKKTWTAKFTTGIAILNEIDLGIDPETVGSILLSVSGTGKRGVGSRVPRRFPMIYGWSATFDILILDPIITEEILREMLELAGMFIGVGRFRPEVGGYNGRFRLDHLNWQDGVFNAAA